MPEITDDQIQSIIRQAVDAAIVGYAARPPCGLSEKAVPELSHFMGCIKDVGGGGEDGYGRGIELFRSSMRTIRKIEILLTDDAIQEDMRFVRRWRTARDKTGNIVLGVVVVAVVGVVLKITDSGFWRWIKAGIEKIGE
jgi:hypothetical protein